MRARSEAVYRKLFGLTAYHFEPRVASEDLLESQPPPRVRPVGQQQ